MQKQKITYVCQLCGYESQKWLGKCPSCGEWNTFSEEITEIEKNSKIVLVKSNISPISLSDTPSKDLERIRTGIDQLDELLNGGVVKGQALLISGEPGIGKSTICLQFAKYFSKFGKVLYINSEESSTQIKIRAERMKINEKTIFLYPENILENIVQFLTTNTYDFVILDSIQNIMSAKFASSPGTVTQVRECASRLTEISKYFGFPLFMIGHVNKEGMIAGPKTIEHIVDTIIMIEKDQRGTYRIFRITKNRFGPTNEIAIFHLSNKGMEEVENIFTINNEELVGSVVCPIIEGTRSIPVEIQTLVNETQFGYPKRTSDGIDINRLHVIIAIMDKYIRTKLSSYDIYLNVTNGIEIRENASDLAIAYSLLSSLRGKEISKDLAIFGELGLGGEVRPVPYIIPRITCLSKLGIKRVVLPAKNRNEIQNFSALRIIQVKELYDILDLI